jgi:hypothetical protein
VACARVFHDDGVVAAASAADAARRRRDAVARAMTQREVHKSNHVIPMSDHLVGMWGGQRPPSAPCVRARGRRRPSLLTRDMGVRTADSNEKRRLGEELDPSSSEDGAKGDDFKRHEVKRPVAKKSRFRQ